MRPLKLTIVIVLLAGGLSGGRADAAPGRCEVTDALQAGAFGFVWLHNCRYLATGPGEYRAATVNHWRISVSKDGGTTFKTVIAGSKQLVRLAPASLGGASLWSPGVGTLPTVAGDVVDVAIYPEPLQPAPGVKVSLPFAGYLEAGDV